MRTVRKYKNGGTEPTRFEKAFAEALEAGDKTFMFDKDGDGVMEEFTTDILTQTPGGRIGEEQVFTGTPEQFAIIQEGQGAYPLGTAEVGADFVPRNKEEQDAYDNLGVEGALAVRKLMANVAGDRSKFAEDYVLPFLMNALLPGAMGGGPLAYGVSSRTPSILSLIICIPIIHVAYMEFNLKIYTNQQLQDLEEDLEGGLDLLKRVQGLVMGVSKVWEEFQTCLMILFNGICPLLND